jgi:hypothetical protein
MRLETHIGCNQEREEVWVRQTDTFNSHGYMCLADAVVAVTQLHHTTRARSNVVKINTTRIKEIST